MIVNLTQSGRRLFAARAESEKSVVEVTSIAPALAQQAPFLRE
jgi:hypothetical protein